MYVKNVKNKKTNKIKKTKLWHNNLMRYKILVKNLYMMIWNLMSNF